MKDNLKISDKVIILDTETSRRIFSDDAIGHQANIIENGPLGKLLEVFYGKIYTVEYKYGMQCFPAKEANKCVQKIKE